MELLPAQRDTRQLPAISQRRGQLTQRSIASHDGVVVICDRDSAPAALRQLPFAALLQRLYQRAAERGPVEIPSTRVTPEAIPLIIGFAKGTASAFERLSHAARIWKELATSAPRDVLFATGGMAIRQSDAMLEAMLAAALAGSVALPNLKSKPPRPAALSAITLIRDGAALDLERSIAVHRGNHLARWLTTLPPNVLGSLNYRRALKTLAAQHGWGFSFLNEASLKRLGAGAFLAVTRANGHPG